MRQNLFTNDDHLLVESRNSADYELSFLITRTYFKKTRELTDNLTFPSALRT
jgi:hypothetical protein